VGLKDDGSAAARRFHERVRSPLLTDIQIDWAGLPVSDVYPKRVPDLFSARPVVLTGRYTKGGRATIRLRGKMSGRDFVREIPVELPEAEARHDVLATLWARTRIDDLMREDYMGVQGGKAHADMKEPITQLGLEFRLMTQFTSFVAVEEMVVTDGGQPRRIEVPVELPEGVNRADVIQEADDPRGFIGQFYVGRRGAQSVAQPNSPPTVTLSAAKVKAPAQVYKSTGNANVGGGGSGAGGAAVVAADSTINFKTELPKPVPTPVPTRAEEKQQRLVSKLNPALVAVVERLKNKGAQPGAGEAKFVRDGKAEIQVWLTDKTEANLARLKALGFEVLIDPKTSKMVIGRVSLDKLAELAELEFVRYVTPMKDK
ncbi:MAG TPA: hypothetical protein VJT09_05675, partial [Pyrinomonadaceae bacterium]|nr:hypothetical protein [Pyrinomonadaceae bacterium]